MVQCFFRRKTKTLIRCTDLNLPFTHMPTCTLCWIPTQVQYTEIISVKPFYSNKQRTSQRQAGSCVRVPSPSPSIVKGSKYLLMYFSLASAWANASFFISSAAFCIIICYKKESQDNRYDSEWSKRKHISKQHINICIIKWQINTLNLPKFTKIGTSLGAMNGESCFGPRWPDNKTETIPNSKTYWSPRVRNQIFPFWYTALNSFLASHLLITFANCLDQDWLFQNQLFPKIISGILSECQAVWIQIMTKVLSALI